MRIGVVVRQKSIVLFIRVVEPACSGAGTSGETIVSKMTTISN